MSPCFSILLSLEPFLQTFCLIPDQFFLLFCRPPSSAIRCLMRCVWFGLLAAALYHQSSASDCARNIFSSSPISALLESPHFPTSYPAGTNCVYNISSVVSNVLHITFLTFDLAEPHPETGQCLDAYVVIVVVDRQVSTERERKIERSTDCSESKSGKEMECC